MNAIRVGIGLIWLLSLVAGRAGWYSASASRIPATSAEFTAQAVPAPYGVAGESMMEQGDSAAGEDPRVDLFGNEVEEAVADYRVDLRGSVYERHSPETAVQKLAAPST